MASSPFFIVGHERSGTTLMAAAFDRHSRIAVPPETHFFTDLCRAEDAHQSGDPAFMVSHLFRGARTRDLGLDPSELLRRLADAKPTWADLFLKALELYAEGQGKELLGEKTPNHWREVAKLLKLFPNSRVIWGVRDGRDTVLSLMNTPWKRHSSLALHALTWCNTMDRMLGFESQFPDRILRVRFEDLVQAPQAEIIRACKFIGVDFEPRQLDHSLETGVVPAWERPWKGRVFAPPDPGRIGTALRELPEASLGLLNSLMGPSMRQLGYRTDGDSAAIAAGNASLIA